MKTLRILMLAASPLLLLGASRPDPMDLVRQANTAFAKKDFRSALQLYQQAESRIADPGLVAFNKAAVLYQLGLQARKKSPAEATGHFRAAEESFRCAAEDIAEPRRLLARLGVASSLLQGRPEKEEALVEAVKLYRESLASPALDESQKADARHNLEVAKLLLLQVQSRVNPERKEKDPGGDNETKPPERNPKDPAQQQNTGDPMRGTGQPRPTEQPGKAQDGQKPIQTSRTEAGKGNLENLLDDTPTPPLTDRVAADELSDAVRKILEQQRVSRLRGARTPAGPVKDW